MFIEEGATANATYVVLDLVMDGFVVADQRAIFAETLITRVASVAFQLPVSALQMPPEVRIAAEGLITLITFRIFSFSVN